MESSFYNNGSRLSCRCFGVHFVRNWRDSKMGHKWKRDEKRARRRRRAATIEYLKLNLMKIDLFKFLIIHIL